MQTRAALKRLSKGKVNVDYVAPDGPLAHHAKRLVEAYNNKEAEMQVSKRRHEVAASLPVLQAARKKADEMLRDDVMSDDLPIVSRFDAFSVIKDASRKSTNDIGLRKLALHLERLWHKEPLGSITIGALSRIRDHYQYENPRSKVAEIVDTAIPKVSFKTLPVANLTRVASQINTQEDYDLAITRNGLQGNDPISVRARTFIRELVNRKGDKQETAQEFTKISSKDKPDVPKKVSGGDIATRVANRLNKLSQEVEDEKEDKEACEGEEMPKLTAEAISAENKEFTSWLKKNAGANDRIAVAPPGWEGTVKEMKSFKDIVNHNALAWFMLGKGYTPTAKTAQSEKADFEPKVNDQQPAQVKVPEEGSDALRSDTEFKQQRLTLKADKAIEEVLLTGKEVRKAGYTLSLSQDNSVILTTKKGQKTYRLLDINSAIADFVYLTSTSKHPAGSPPQPMFYIREGIRLNCPGCYTSSYHDMPKSAESLSCERCKAIIPSRVVSAAFNAGAAHEESLICVVTPVALQDEFGDKFAKITDVLKAQQIVVDGCIVRAHLSNPTDNILADAWDSLVAAGFRPLAQVIEDDDKDESEEADALAKAWGSAPKAAQFEFGEEKEEKEETEELSPTHEKEEGEEAELADEVGEMAERLEEISEEMADMEHHGQMEQDFAPAMETEPEMSPTGAWADQQVVQAAMMHYQHQGMNPIEAIAQFNKDYGNDESKQFDPETVLQIAASVWGIGLDAIKVGMKKKSDIPTPSKVNPQQPDAATAENPGPDSEQMGEIPSEKAKTQVKPQGNFSNTSIEPDTEGKDPGDFGAGSTDAQHGATDQAGVSLPATDLGADSDTGDNKVTKKLDSVSKSAQVKQDAMQLAKAVVDEMALNPSSKLSQLVDSTLEQWETAQPDQLKKILDRNQDEKVTKMMELYYVIAGNPQIAAQFNKVIEKAQETGQIAASKETE